MALDDLAGDRKSKAGPRQVGGGRCAEEALTDPREFLWRNPDALIAHLDDRVAVLRSGGDPHLATLTVELDCVRDEVGEALLQTPRITLDHELLRRFEL